LNKRGLMIENGPCCVVGGCRFVNATEDTSTNDRGIACTFGAGKETPVPGVMACCILPNWFDNVQTAIEVDPGDGAAQDCVVFPQRINAGTGQMILPTGLSDSGLMLLGNRKLGSGGLARGVFVPPRVNTGGNPLPSLTSAEAGYVLFDTTAKTLRIWDGGVWRLVNVT
jgi:hypothetical protein